MSDEINPQEELDLVDVYGNKVTLELTPLASDIPMTISTASLDACYEISMYFTIVVCFIEC